MRLPLYTTMPGNGLPGIARYALSPADQAGGGNVQVAFVVIRMPFGAPP